MSETMVKTTLHERLKGIVAARETLGLPANAESTLAALSAVTWAQELAAKEDVELALEASQERLREAIEAIRRREAAAQ